MFRRSASSASQGLISTATSAGYEVQSVASGRRRSFVQILTGRTPKRPEDGEWKVGCRYEAIQTTYLFDSQKMTGEAVCELKPKDIILLLRHQICSGSVTGFVMTTGDPGQRRYAGWMPLNACRQSSLEGSWELKGRYRVQHPSTLRSKADISSSWVAEVVPDSEVIVIEIGVHIDPNDTSASRLRLKVAVCSADFSDDVERVVGWLSAETLAGNQLLYPVNLLSMDAVAVHQNMSKKGHPMDGAVRRLSKSFTLGSGVSQLDDALASLPWKVGGHYRVLEKLTLRASAALNSKKCGTLPIGAIVSVTEMYMMECPYAGWCPCALVSSSSTDTKSKLKERRGWIRCAGKDGRNHIDERDQLEFEKVINIISKSQTLKASQRTPNRLDSEKRVQISPHPPALREIAPNRRGEEPSDDDGDYEDWDEDSEDEYFESEEEEEGSFEGDSTCDEDAQGRGPVISETSPAAVAMKEIPTMKEAPAAKLNSNEDHEAKQRKSEQDFARKLQSLEIGAKEEKLVDTNTILTDKSACCGCGSK